MNLQKAIEIVELGPPKDDRWSHWSYDHAVKLLIEAGKQVQFYRSIPNGHVHNLLPGETQD